MAAEVWVVVLGVILAGVAGTVWSARKYYGTAAGYQKQVDASDVLHGRSEAILDRQEELHRRSLAVLDRQEELLRRAELLVERLEKLRSSG
jgi:hypothetical protein